MKYGLIGKKISTNLPKEITSRFGIEDYQIIEATTSELTDLIASKNFEAINVVSPYKKTVIELLDEVDTIANTIGAVDTIINRDGKLFGYNTDYQAFMYMIEKNNIDFSNQKVLILGNGGTSAAVKYVASQLNAGEIVVVSANNEPGTVSYIDCFASHLDSDIVINTTPVGKSPDIDNAPISMSLFSKCHTLIDVIHSPILTKLGFEAQECNIKRIIGIQMLVAQTKIALELMTNTTISHTIEDVIHDVITSQANIVLIGMPSAGKTTIGKMLAKQLGKEFIDLDDIVIEKAKMTIPEIFAKSGEAGFRKLESLIALELSRLNNKIIGTGGGTIKNKINMDYLRLNGITIFIDRDVDRLISNDPNRPLSSSQEALKTLHAERLPLYQKYAAAIVVNNANIEDTVTQIINEFNAIAKDAVK